MIKHLAITGLVMLIAVGSAAVQAGTSATAEPMDMDPAILSKLALERAKARNAARLDKNSGASTGLDGNNPAECGSVNIGNVMTGGKPGFQPREITVVITGDVINANNKCK
jgi:hypothetical protein